MYDVCLDALPFLVGGTLLAVGISRCWQLVVEVIADRG
jgi:hypothetical protein